MSTITDEARRWAQRPFAERTFQVGRNDIMRFAYAIGATDAVHTDVSAARTAGYRDLLAPAYFPYTLRMHASNLTERHNLELDGSASEDVPPLDTKRAMAGETEIEFGSPVFAGDVITVSKRIVDLYEKHGRSGTMVFVKTEFKYSNQHDEIIMSERFTRIFR